MEKRFDGPDPVRDVVYEKMNPTTMHGTRDTVTIVHPRQDLSGIVEDANRGFVGKLLQQITDKLRRFTD